MAETAAERAEREKKEKAAQERATQARAAAQPMQSSGDPKPGAREHTGRGSGTVNVATPGTPETEEQKKTREERERVDSEGRKAQKDAAKTAASDPPKIERPPTSASVAKDPSKDVYERAKGDDKYSDADLDKLREEGVTPNTPEAIDSTIIKSNLVASMPQGRPDNELVDEDGEPAYKAGDVITEAGVTVMCIAPCTYKPPGGGEEQYLTPGTRIVNFVGTLAKAHVVLDEE